MKFLIKVHQGGVDELSLPPILQVTYRSAHETKICCLLGGLSAPLESSILNAHVNITPLAKLFSLTHITFVPVLPMFHHGLYFINKIHLVVQLPL